MGFIWIPLRIFTWLPGLLMTASNCLPGCLVVVQVFFLAFYFCFSKKCYHQMDLMLVSMQFFLMWIWKTYMQLFLLPEIAFLFVIYILNVFEQSSISVLVIHAVISQQLMSIYMNNFKIMNDLDINVSTLCTGIFSYILTVPVQLLYVQPKNGHQRGLCITHEEYVEKTVSL